MNKRKLYDILTSQDILKSINENIEYILNIIPELKDIIGFEHKHPHHHLDVYQHTLLALSLSPQDFEIRLVLLLHDIGKPYSFQDEKIRHFKGHAEISAQISYNILKRLSFSEEEIDKICYLIREHDSVITDDEIIGDKEIAIMKYKIQICDALAHNPNKLEKRIKYLLDINEKLSIEEESLQLILKYKNKNI